MRRLQYCGISPALRPPTVFSLRVASHCVLLCQGLSDFLLPRETCHLGYGPDPACISTGLMFMRASAAMNRTLQAFVQSLGRAKQMWEQRLWNIFLRKQPEIRWRRLPQEAFGNVAALLWQVKKGMPPYSKAMATAQWQSAALSASGCVLHQTRTQGTEDAPGVDHTPSPPFPFLWGAKCWCPQIWAWPIGRCDPTCAASNWAERDAVIRIRMNKCPPLLRC